MNTRNALFYHALAGWPSRMPAGRAEEKRGTETALAYMMQPAAGRWRDERRDDGEEWHP
jgi:hypothetical protein